MKKVETTTDENGCELRKCNRCDTFLPRSEYYSKCKNNPNWIDSVCKKCRRTKSLKRQSKFREDINDKKRKKTIKKNGYQSPFNYIGNKYSLLNDMKQYLPENIDTFIDLFSGSSTVGINIDANKIICNDLDNNVINFFNICKHMDIKNIIEKIEDTISEYNPETKDGYIKLRDVFNSGNRDWFVYYVLSCYSFNQHILYNKKGKCSSGYGNGLTKFNPMLKRRLCEYVEFIQNKNIEYINKSYDKFLSEYKLTNKDFVYIDPPYLLSDVNYLNNWTNELEIELLNYLDWLNDNGVRFMLSNVLIHKEKINHILDKWKDKYKVIYLDNNFNRICRNHEDENESVEILVINY